MKNKVSIDGVSGTGGGPAEGSTVFTSKYLNLAPFAGFRFRPGEKTKIDLSGSFDLAFGIGHNHEKGSAIVTATMVPVHTDRDRDKLGFDPRVGIQARIGHKKLSLHTGYWFGLHNFYKGYIGGNPEAHSRLFRIGLAYHLNRYAGIPAGTPKF